MVQMFVFVFTTKIDENRRPVEFSWRGYLFSFYDENRRSVLALVVGMLHGPSARKTNTAFIHQSMRVPFNGLIQNVSKYKQRCIAY